MISKNNIVELNLEVYKLIGVKNLLKAWANETAGYEAKCISDALSDTVQNILKILDIQEE